MRDELLQGVGYKRPPKHAQLQPGQSGNPRGRSRGAPPDLTLTEQPTLEAVLRIAAKPVKIREGDHIAEVPMRVAMVQAIFNAGATGNARAQGLPMGLMRTTNQMKAALTRRQEDEESTSASTPVVKEPALKAKHGLRLPAAGIERLVFERMLQFLATPSEVLTIGASDIDPKLHPNSTLDAVGQSALLEAAQGQASSLSAADFVTQRSFLLGALQGVDVHRDRVEIRIGRPGLLQRLRDGHGHGADGGVGGANPVILEDDVGTRRSDEPALATHSSARDVILLTVPVAFKRSGFELRLVVPGKETAARPDPSLVRLVARAHQMRDRLVADPDQTITQLAEQERLTASYLARLLRLAFLAPDIVTALLEGRQPLELSANKLMADTRLPIDWAGQRQALGFR